MHLFSFKGRARRLEFWEVMFVFGIILRVLELIPDDAYESILVCLIVLSVVIVSLWASIATCTRRCHDLGHNGWWQLIPFYSIWMGFVPGKPEDNKFGPDPKGGQVEDM